MEYRDYTPPDWDVTVPEVLVAACERCGEVVGIPHQSTPRINEYRKVKPETGFTKSIEARVPREIDEALDLMTVALGGASKVVRTAVMRFYFAEMARRPEVAAAVKRQSAGTFQGQADRRVSIKLTNSQWSRVSKASKAAGIRSKSDLIRGVAMLAAADCRITTADTTPATIADKGSRSRLSHLKRLVEIL